MEDLVRAKTKFIIRSLLLFTTLIAMLLGMASVEPVRDALLHAVGIAAWSILVSPHRRLEYSPLFGLFLAIFAIAACYLDQHFINSAQVHAAYALTALGWNSTRSQPRTIVERIIRLYSVAVGILVFVIGLFPLGGDIVFFSQLWLLGSVAALWVHLWLEPWRKKPIFGLSMLSILLFWLSVSVTLLAIVGSPVAFAVSHHYELVGMFVLSLYGLALGQLGFAATTFSLALDLICNPDISARRIILGYVVCHSCIMFAILAHIYNVF